LVRHACRVRRQRRPLRLAHLPPDRDRCRPLQLAPLGPGRYPTSGLATQGEHSAMIGGGRLARRETPYISCQEDSFGRSNLPCPACPVAAASLPIPTGKLQPKPCGPAHRIASIAHAEGQSISAAVRPERMLATRRLPSRETLPLPF